MKFDWMTIVMLAVLAVLILFMFRNSRKRQKDAQDLQSKVQPGATVMTNFGMFGTIVSIDEAENRVALEIAPGTVVDVHRQVVARVVEPSEAGESAPALAENGAAEPEFGERLDHPGTDEAPGTAKND